jgi:biotin synthase
MQIKIKEIVDRALDGRKISSKEIRDLFLVPVISDEAYYIQFASRKISEALSSGKAEIHAQVGINVGLLPQKLPFLFFCGNQQSFSWIQLKELRILLTSV